MTLSRLILLFCLSWVVSPGSVVFSDGFESGDMSHTQGAAHWLGGANTAVSTAEHASGGYSLRFQFKAHNDPNNPQGGNGYAWAEQRFDLGALHPELYIRYKLYVPANYDHRINPLNNGQNNKFIRLWATDYNNKEKVGASFWKGSISTFRPDWAASGGSMGPKPQGDPGVSGFISSSDKGAWMDIIIHYKTATATTNGTLRFWKNGTLVGDYTDLVNNYTAGEQHGARYGYLLGWANSGFVQETLLYIDDVIFGTTWTDVQGSGGSVPAAPSGLTATAASGSQINLGWADNANNETGFKIDRKTGSGGTYAQAATPGANATTHNNSGLTAGTTYYYRVRATNANGDSAWSNEASATTTSSGAPEINVTGNGATIADGDTAPSAVDHTDFGSADVSGATVTRTYTVQNTGTTALTVNTVTLSGTHAGDFSVTAQPAASVTAGGSTTFNVRFDPSATGTRTAAVSFGNTDANENPYNFSIQGTGTATPAVIGPLDFNGLTNTKNPTTNTTTNVNSASAMGGTWLQYNSTANGQSISFTVNVPATGTYQVTVNFAKASNQGVCQLDIDGVNHGPTQNLYSTVGMMSAVFSSVNIGSPISLTAGNHTFRFTVTAAGNDGGRKLGFDKITLTP